MLYLSLAARHIRKEETMAVYLITYDHRRTSRIADPILRVVRQYQYVQLAEGCYAIETFEKTRTIWNKIVSCLNGNVHLLVVTLVKPFSGPVFEPASKWLAEHLPED